MITFEQAEQIAKKANKNVNAYREYKVAWHFFDDASDSDGDAGVVVMKSNGNTKSFFQFLMGAKPKKTEMEKPERKL